MFFFLMCLVETEGQSTRIFMFGCFFSQQTPGRDCPRRGRAELETESVPQITIVAGDEVRSPPPERSVHSFFPSPDYKPMT